MPLRHCPNLLELFEYCDDDNETKASGLQSCAKAWMRHGAFPGGLG